MTAKLSPKEGALTWNERRSKKDHDLHGPIRQEMVTGSRSASTWSRK